MTLTAGTCSNTVSTVPNESVLSVFEHQRLTVTDFIYHTDFDWLMAQEFAVFSVHRQRGQWQLKVGHYIGIIMLPSGMTLEILPKAVANMSKYKPPSPADITLTRQWSQRMLTALFNNGDTTAHHNKSKPPHTQHLGQFSTQISALSSQTFPLSAWLADQFLQRLFSHSPLKSYQTQRETQSWMQGKLLIKEQLRHHGIRPHHFVSEVSVLNQNIFYNRMIKSALSSIQLLHPNVIFSTQWRMWQSISVLSLSEWRQLSPLYQRAKHELSTQPLAPAQAQSAQQLLDMSYWLLQNQQPSLHTGSSLQPSLSFVSPPRLCLLINMNQAFEQWVSHCLVPVFSDQSTQNLTYHIRCQPRDIWLRDDSGQTCVSVQPDLLIYRQQNSYQKNNPENSAQSQQCSHVIDIKWKHLAHARDITASDAYQLTSYAQAYHAEQVWLIYPVIDDNKKPVLLKQAPHPANYHAMRHADLWLVPFNVNTGTLNQLPTTETS